MVQTAELDNPEHRAAPRRGSIVAIVLAVVVGVVLGYLGWVLPSPGASLAIPVLIVLGIGVVLVGCSSIVARIRPRGGSLWIFAATVGILGLFATAWTYWFSLPAAMWSDSGAQQQAQNALNKLAREPESVHGVPINHCWTIETGTIGPLEAPYKECAISTSLGSKAFIEVSFTSVGSPEQNIQYTNVGSSAFYDQCYRHLVGSWWMTTPDHSGVGNCPFGYQFHGGP